MDPEIGDVYTLVFFKLYINAYVWLPRTTSTCFHCSDNVFIQNSLRMDVWAHVWYSFNMFTIRFKQYGMSTSVPDIRTAAIRMWTRGRIVYDSTTVSAIIAFIQQLHKQEMNIESFQIVSLRRWK